MIQKFWNDFKTKNNMDKSLNYAGTFCFGTDAKQAAEALSLILEGRKTAMIYPENGYRCAMKGAANAGDLNIITDWNGMPKAIIKTAKVSTLAFDALTDEICRADGAYENADAWREACEPALKLEIEELGHEFNENTRIVVEEFHLIFEE